MKIYHNDCTEPYENLATEEYLIDTSDGEDIFMLWRNEPSVIIGRNQNAYAEIDREYAEKHGIKAVRRLTGGGAVFHDLGNLNYTFITADTEGGKLNFARFSEPIVDALRALGLGAELSGRNDITVDGFKISGTAQCVRNDRVMHHGTLLWDADLSGMSGVLRPDETKLAAKGIKSVRSRVANLRSLLLEKHGGAIPDGIPGDVLSFRDYLEARFGGAAAELSAEQRKGIRALTDQKYATWEWNFGMSKQFEAERKKRFPFGLVEVHMSCDRGRITDIRIRGDFFGSAPIEELEGRLRGRRCAHDDIADVMRDAGKYIFGADGDALCELIVF